MAKKSVELMMKKQKSVKLVKPKRINYSQENVEMALKAIQDMGYSLRKAASLFGIPVATLGRKKNLDPGKSKRKTGPGTVFSEAEEKNIVAWIKHRAEIGAPVTKNELLDSVQKYVISINKKTPFNNDRPSRHWYERFTKQYPELAIRKSQHVNINRAEVSQEHIGNWFQNIKNYLERKTLLKIPSTRVFNCGETSIQLCPNAENVLTGKGKHSVYKRVDEGKETLSVLFMYRGDGIRAPPMLLYPYKKSVPNKIIENTPNDWGIGISDNGRMTTESFYEYITNVFYPWLIEENTVFPIIVYMNNHSSHLNLPLVHFCQEKEIELIMLPPNSTHILQPLDLSFFHPFKQTWQKCVPKWKSQYGVTKITKENFPIVLQYTLDSMSNAETIVQSGFIESGLHPFNPRAVDCDILNEGNKCIENADSEITKEQTFLHYFEENLPTETLSDFKTAESSGCWTGEIEKKALFEYWLDIKEKSTDIKNIKLL